MKFLLSSSILLCICSSSFADVLPVECKYPVQAAAITYDKNGQSTIRMDKIPGSDGIQGTAEASVIVADFSGASGTAVIIVDYQDLNGVCQAFNPRY